MPALSDEDRPKKGIRKTMTMREREGLIARIRQLRRLTPAADLSARHSGAESQNDRV